MRLLMMCLMIPLLLCRIAVAQEGAPTPIRPTRSVHDLPGTQIPLAFERVGNGKVQIDEENLNDFLNLQIAAREVSIEVLDRAAKKVEEAKAQVEDNTEQLSLGNAQAELNNKRFKEALVAFDEALQNNEVLEGIIVQINQVLAATRAEHATTRQHLHATQWELNGTRGALGQASQMMDKMRGRALLPFPFSTALNILDPI